MYVRFMYVFLSHNVPNFFILFGRTIAISQQAPLPAFSTLALSYGKHILSYHKAPFFCKWESVQPGQFNRPWLTYCRTEAFQWALHLKNNVYLGSKREVPWCFGEGWVKSLQYCMRRRLNMGSSTLHWSWIDSGQWL